MKRFDEKKEFLESLHQQKAQFAIKKDFSIEPGCFKQMLRISGVYLYGRAFSDLSKQLSKLELDMIIFNEIDLSKVVPPEGFFVFRLRDLQEFPYSAAVRIPPPIKK